MISSIVHDWSLEQVRYHQGICHGELTASQVCLSEITISELIKRNALQGYRDGDRLRIKPEIQVIQRGSKVLLNAHL